MRTQYEYGVDAERRLAKKFQEQGAIVVRAAGSHGPIDLVVIDKDGTHLIQVKATREGSPRDAVLRAYADAALVVRDLPPNCYLEAYCWSGRDRLWHKAFELGQAGVEEGLWFGNVNTVE